MAKLEQKYFVPNQLQLNLQHDHELKYIPSSAVQLHSNNSVNSSQRGKLAGNRKMSYQDNFKPRNHSNHHSNTRLKHNQSSNLQFQSTADIAQHNHPPLVPKPHPHLNHYSSVSGINTKADNKNEKQ
jgi:hypothetical protein